MTNMRLAREFSKLQVELTKLQSNDSLKAMYLIKPLLQLLCAYISAEEFPNLRDYAFKWS